MTVLLIVAIVAVATSTALLAIKVLLAFQRRAFARFGYKFFRVWHFLSIIVGIICIVLGRWVRTTSFNNASHLSNGLVLMILGVGLLGWVLCQNCCKTNLFHGVVGTVLEVMISPWVFSIEIFIIPALLLGGVQYLTATPGRVVNQGW
jgi:hypothetical protein